MVELEKWNEFHKSSPPSCLVPDAWHFLRRLYTVGSHATKIVAHSWSFVTLWPANNYLLTPLLDLELLTLDHFWSLFNKQSWKMLVCFTLTRNTDSDSLLDQARVIRSPEYSKSALISVLFSSLLLCCFSHCDFIQYGWFSGATAKMFTRFSISKHMICIL